MNEYKDFFGQTVKVGDEVAVIQAKYHYLCTGIVERISSTRVWIAGEQHFFGHTVKRPVNP